MAWASDGKIQSERVMVCPRCAGAAVFAQAPLLSLGDADQIERFRRLPEFMVSQSAHGLPIALYREGAGGRPMSEIPELTEQERVDLGLLRSDPDLAHEGSVRCGSCGHRAMHRLTWPAEAFYQIEHRGAVLWAYDRAGAEALAIMAETPGMKPSDQPAQADFLKRAPTEFFTAKSRDAVAKKLRKRLSEGAK